MPNSLGKEITESIPIPTIGIGAGPDCDGQILVLHDLLGLTRGRIPSFVKRYRSLADDVIEAVREFSTEVRGGLFPDHEHGYEG